MPPPLLNYRFLAYFRETSFNCAHNLSDVLQIEFPQCNFTTSMEQGETNSLCSSPPGIWRIASLIGEYSVGHINSRLCLTGRKASTATSWWSTGTFEEGEGEGSSLACLTLSNIFTHSAMNFFRLAWIWSSCACLFSLHMMLISISRSTRLPDTARAFSSYRRINKALTLNLLLLKKGITQ